MTAHGSCTIRQKGVLIAISPNDHRSIHQFSKLSEGTGNHSTLGRCQDYSHSVSRQEDIPKKKDELKQMERHGSLRMCVIHAQYSFGQILLSAEFSLRLVGTQLSIASVPKRFQCGMYEIMTGPESIM